MAILNIFITNFK